MSTQKTKLFIRQIETANNFTIRIMTWIMSRLHRKPRVDGVRPEVEAFLQQSLNERPDIWRDLANSPPPQKSPASTR